MTNLTGADDVLMTTRYEHFPYTFDTKAGVIPVKDA